MDLVNAARLSKESFEFVEGNLFPEEINQIANGNNCNTIVGNYQQRQPNVVAKLLQ